MKLSDSLAYPPRGLSRDEAARYVGVGTTKFDEMVKDGRMPRPKRLDGRVVWDRFALDMSFNSLPSEEDSGDAFFERLFDKRKTA